MDDAGAQGRSGVAGLAQGILQETALGAARGVREATYVAVGLGLMGVNRLQVHRRQLQGRLTTLGAQGLQGARAEGARQVPNVEALVDEAVQMVDALGLEDLVDEAVQLVESSLEPLQEYLPAAARDLAQRAVVGARVISSQVRDRRPPAA